MTRPTLHLIAGPTASGKSALALEIARRERGTIINADAMQVYAGLPLLTAQPSPEDKKEIPHELYEAFDPAERSSAGRWRALAEDAIRRAVESERTPILVGGTGLYFKALLEGLAEIPPVPESVRRAAQELYAKLGEKAFRAGLAKLDSGSAERIKPNDKQRLIRAYEVAIHTGQPIGHWQSLSSSRTSEPKASADPGSSTISASDLSAEALAKAETSPQNSLSHTARGRSPLDSGFRRNDKLMERFTLIPHLLLPPREELYAACDRRFLDMMERGAIEEVRDLLARNLDPDLPAMKILGVREITAFLRGEVSREEAIARAQQATRNYAKRQMTWFRNQWTEGRDPGSEKIEM
ncbi:MAG: tRNA (adenosine(37)-N6)-dimethylallyltransferase MiaA [Alphaproteobacteria bacterium]|nr:tRNA (adenosine(37)-N6)-dimethylallyltransferase MiaA [Alphaproteobacteria bacterium]